ncbi:hypothetical protein [Glutamicibacter arilaitensis]|uniref:hypothetical protein n=1 Tax=Glutamicibacter arilaitensis TaxID=256701 RepID=UPI00384F80A1
MKNSLDEENSPESLHESAMIGTPAEVVERLRRYEELGVTEFRFWNDNTLSHAEKKRSLELFIEQAMPHFAQVAVSQK